MRALLAVVTLLAGCRFGFDTHPGGVPGAVTRSWTFDDPSELSFVDSEVVVDAGFVRLAAIDNVDDDGSPTGFGGGTGNATWNATDNLLQPAGPSATFTSRVIDAGGVVAWSQLAWASERPSGKPLPDDDSETEYALGNVDLTSIRLLAHFDEPSGVIGDTSGNNHSGVNVGGGYGAPGRFGSALRLSGGEHVDFGKPAGLSITGDFTLSTWVKRGAIGVEQFIMSKESAPVGAGWCLYFTPTDRIELCVGDGVGTGMDDSITTTAFASTTTWHHIVATHESGLQRVFVNGVAQPWQVGGAFSTVPGVSDFQLEIGRRYTNTDFFVGDVDEIAVWARTLSAAEVIELYRRGATRIDLQIRTCDDPACEGESFVGPGGSVVAGFVAPARKGQPVIDLDAPPARYAQYRVTFQSDVVELPRLERVLVGSDLVFAGVATVTAVESIATTRFVGMRAAVSSGEPRFQLSADGITWYVAAGDGWRVANDVDDVSTAAEITIAAPNYISMVGTQLQWRAVLHSPGGLQSIVVDDVQLDYVP